MERVEVYPLFLSEVLFVENRLKKKQWLRWTIAAAYSDVNPGRLFIFCLVFSGSDKIVNAHSEMKETVLEIIFQES